MTTMMVISSERVRFYYFCLTNLISFVLYTITQLRAAPPEKRESAGKMEGVEELTLAAAFTRGQATYHLCQTGGADEVRARERER